MLEKLPLELLECILSNEIVGHEEIGAVSKVSSRFRSFCWNSNELWKTKFRQRWSKLWHEIETKNSDEIWRELYRRRNLIHNLLPNQVAQMSSVGYQKNHLSKTAFDFYVEMMSENKFGYEFVVDELKCILNDGKTYDNLTTKYYAKKVLSCIRQTHLRTVWKDFLLSSDQSIEKGAVLLAQWFQPSLDFELDLNERMISKWLDDIASLCLKNVTKLYKDHPLSRMNLLSSSDETVHLSGSLWSPELCTQVLKALNQTMFEELGFRGDTDHYYSTKNSYINKVLEQKTGIPITLCIVYMCVARRLGVVCEPVGYPVHFLLRYLQHPTLSMDEQYTYIDVFGKGTFLRENELNVIIRGVSEVPQSDWFNISPQAVFERMTGNLVEYSRHHFNEGDVIHNCLMEALELMLLLRPHDIEQRLFLCRVYITLNINLAEVMSTLEACKTERNAELVEHLRERCEVELQESNKETKVEVHERKLDENVQFAVGMVMYHKVYHYKCVIYGWDERCMASEEWIDRMGVQRLPRGESQPFYNVLVADGSFRYAASENLYCSEQPEFVDHPEIGRHFASFNGIHFVPNEEKIKEYPGDEEELRGYVLNKQGRI